MNTNLVAEDNGNLTLKECVKAQELTIPELLTLFGFQLIVKSNTNRPDQYKCERYFNLNTSLYGVQTRIRAIFAEHHQDGTCDLKIERKRFICLNTVELASRLKRIEMVSKPITGG